MKLRTLLVAFMLLVGITSITNARMNRQRRAGASLETVQATSQQTCINNCANKQLRNGQGNNVQNCARQGNRGQGRNGQGGKGMGRNGQGGNGQHRYGQGANRQGCNCNGTCINQ